MARNAFFFSFFFFFFGILNAEEIICLKVAAKCTCLLFYLMLFIIHQILLPQIFHKHRNSTKRNTLTHWIWGSNQKEQRGKRGIEMWEWGLARVPSPLFDKMPLVSLTLTLLAVYRTLSSATSSQFYQPEMLSPTSVLSSRWKPLLTLVPLLDLGGGIKILALWI